MKDKVYIVVTTTENGKNVSFAVDFAGSCNLVSVLASIPGLTSANICKSKKAAAEIADDWNECYKANGTYMYAVNEEKTA